MLVICDVDETVADNRHRQHLLGSDVRKNWAAFLHPDAVAADTLIPGAREGLAHLVNGGGRVLFLTGRNERLRGVTSHWIREHLGHIVTVSNLTMRPDGEYSKATEFKGRIIREIRFQANSNIPFLYIDDDPYMWPVAESLGGIVLKAPDCWSILNPRHSSLPPEEHWRK